jgi:hypothetical protein
MIVPPTSIAVNANTASCCSDPVLEAISIEGSGRSKAMDSFCDDRGGSY